MRLKKERGGKKWIGRKQEEEEGKAEQDMLTNEQVGERLGGGWLDSKRATNHLNTHDTTLSSTN